MSNAPEEQPASLDGLKKMLEQVSGTDLEEFYFERNGTRIGFKRDLKPAFGQSAQPAQGPSRQAASGQQDTFSGQKAAAEQDRKNSSSYILSPMVGVFYLSLTPESPPLVSEGATVSPGQRVCIVESMRIMNEVVSRAKGRIAKVLVANGRAVEYGQPLFSVEKEPPPGDAGGQVAAAPAAVQQGESAPRSPKAPAPGNGASVSGNAKPA